MSVTFFGYFQHEQYGNMLPHFHQNNNYPQHPPSYDNQQFRNSSILEAFESYPNSSAPWDNVAIGQIGTGSSPILSQYPLLHLPAEPSQHLGKI